ncbi:MAG: outer membrane beta-barrel protein, partial [Bacteroidota bacterium]
GGAANMVSPPSTFETRPGIGYHAGIFAQVTRYESRFFVRPELIYSIRSYELKTPFSREQASFHYFSIPIMFGYKPGKKAGILAGVEPAFMLRSGRPPMLASSNTIDVIVNLGLSYDLTYNTGIELRAGRGLLSLLDMERTDANGSTTKESSGFTQVLQLNISYNFAKEGKSNTTPVLR